jgi:hypothetical protein
MDSAMSMGLSRTSLNFEYVNSMDGVDKRSPVPDRALNGGLYTGEPFAKDAPYANVKVLPYSAYWANENLKTAANVPKQAYFQMQAGYRPGNNSDPSIPGLDFIGGDFKTFGPINTFCVPAICEIKGYKNDIAPSCTKGKCESKVVLPYSYGKFSHADDFNSTY